MGSDVGSDVGSTLGSDVGSGAASGPGQLVAYLSYLFICRETKVKNGFRQQGDFWVSTAK